MRYRSIEIVEKAMKRATLRQKIATEIQYSQWPLKGSLNRDYPCAHIDGEP